MLLKHASTVLRGAFSNINIIRHLNDIAVQNKQNDNKQNSPTITLTVHTPSATRFNPNECKYMKHIFHTSIRINDSTHNMTSSQLA